MTDRERLIELLFDVPEVTVYNRAGGAIADYLIANGVTFAKDINVPSRWTPVTERLPEGGRCVLVYSQDGGVAEGKYNARFKEWVQFRWSVTGLKNVTHWMPLPEPPKEE